MKQVTTDGFLGGILQITQPKSGYRAGTDPVLLAASVPAVAGQSVLELGCGAGVASLCLGARIKGLLLTGVEVQQDYADLARKNAAANAIDLGVVNADLTRLPASISEQSFDHVIANPPYLGPGSGTAAANTGKEIALREVTTLAEWVDVGLRRLQPGGYLSVIQLAERLPELIILLSGRAGSIEVKPLSARVGKLAGRVIVRARKGSRGIFRLHSPLVLHDGTHHAGDKDDFSEAAHAVLRDGHRLVFEN